MSIDNQLPVDLSVQDVWDERIRFAGLANDPAAFLMAALAAVGFSGAALLALLGRGYC
jgi:hypothetical protein